MRSLLNSVGWEIVADTETPPCQHLDFDTVVKVNRFSDKPNHFIVEVEMNCAACKRVLFWKIPENLKGVIWSGGSPFVNIEGYQMNLPAEIKPDVTNAGTPKRFTDDA